MTAQKSDAEFFKERGFGLTMGFGERPALLVVDLVKAFTDSSRMLGANLDAQIAATQPLLEAAHARDIPVIFSTVRYDEADLRDAGIWVLKQKGSVTLARETDGHEIDPRLDFRPGDSLLLEEVCLVLLRHRSCAAADKPPRRYADHRRMHDQRMCARQRRRRAAERLPPDGGARGGRRPFGGGA